VTNRPDVHVRFGALEFAFCHDVLRMSSLITWCP
jgi:hypothetical protein